VKLIGVGGLSSGCGKTAVACLLLKALPGWAAIKVTPCEAERACPHGRDCTACEPPEGEYEIVTDRTSLAAEGKDTARLLEAGAARVAWVRAIPENLPTALAVALDEFADAPGVIVESTSAMCFLDGLHVLVARADESEVKESARGCLDRVDLVAVNSSSPTAGTLRLPQGLPREVLVVPVYPVLPPEHPLNERFLSAVRAAVSRSGVGIAS